MNSTHFQRDLSHRTPNKPTVFDLADRLGVVGETLIVYPWFDPVVDASGQPMCGTYVEQFWLGVLGPTATWLARRLVGGFDHYPDGYELNLPDTAAELGVTFRTDKECPFTRALERLTLFGLAQTYSYGLAVRTRAPLLAPRQLQKLPAHLREAHRLWEQ